MQISQKFDQESNLEIIFVMVDAKRSPHFSPTYLLKSDKLNQLSTQPWILTPHLPIIHFLSISWKKTKKKREKLSRCCKIQIRDKNMRDAVFAELFCKEFIFRNFILQRDIFTDEEEICLRSRLMRVRENKRIYLIAIDNKSTWK